jgi:hypothetical protein
MDYQKSSSSSTSTNFIQEDINELILNSADQFTENNINNDETKKQLRVSKTIVIKKLTTDKSNKKENIPPTIKNIMITKNCNYSVLDLKKYLKQYGLAVSGTKQILHDRLFKWLMCLKSIVKIQSVYRGYFVRSVHLLFVKYSNMIKECVNDQDFYSFEELNTIDKYQLICLKDLDGHVYGFNISSIYQYKQKIDIGTDLTNPYTRNKVSTNFITELSKIVYSSNHNIVSTVIDLEKDPNELQLTFEKRVELRAVSLFQKINSLGNYSDVSWFMNLSRRRIIRMVQELFDIWNFRLNINVETKRSICPPIGDPFGTSMDINILLMSIDELRNLVLSIFENFVFKGIDRDSQCLGSFYVLGSLTLVSSIAADSSPWLFQSFIY